MATMTTRTVTLKLWVSNQIGVDGDHTAHFLRAADRTAPEGVTLDLDAQTLTGEPEAAWRAYLALVQAVAAVGHGFDTPDDEAAALAEVGRPVLTASPTVLDDPNPHLVSSGEDLARHYSPQCATWAEFVASVPGLAEDLGRAPEMVEVTVRRYSDGAELGTVELPAGEWAQYEAGTADGFTWPQGTAHAEDVLTVGQLMKLDREFGTEIDPETTIWFED